MRGRQNDRPGTLYHDTELERWTPSRAPGGYFAPPPPFRRMDLQTVSHILLNPCHSYFAWGGKKRSPGKRTPPWT